MLNPVLVLGATRGVGLELAQQLRLRQIPVTALVRPGSQSDRLADIGVHQILGDATDPETLGVALRSAGAGVRVVSTLSGRLPDGEWVEDIAHRVLARIAQKADVKRIVLVTSIGCGEMAPYRSERAIVAFGAAVDAKTRGENAIRASGLPYTFIRPGGLISEPATGRGILSEDPQIHGMIHREDVATLICEVLSNPEAEGRAFAAVDQDQARSDNALVAACLSA
ncbi:SDR family oxidoreductase [Marinobacter salexigens]|uniref:SDR family oxidoreductase n=1 Tax=Marinobacter salexigens TaxID=1925763 RepID=A0ABS6A5L6_9GAMM|nr:SDR family oxidoreductase [Marinobacter salexigens]MBU2873039.1 SDR family oxidoreductase [Marinobacter salexigens]